MTDAFLLAHGAHDESQDQQMAAIDDPTDFPTYWNDLATGPFKDEVNAAVVGLDDVVFETATARCDQVPLGRPGLQHELRQPLR